MGISGLLPLLKSITRKTHIESLSGHKVAIDAYSWLHKGVYSCAIDIYYNRPTNGFVEFCLGRIRLLRNHNVEPIMIFDGTPLPIKSSKELERRSKRHIAKSQLEAIVAREGSINSEAIKTLAAKAIDVTPEMAWQLIEALKKEQVGFIVAPYEADAQMAYLSKIGKVEAVITEDSDLLLYGVRRCLFKMDKIGNIDEIRTEDLGKARELALHTFSLVMFRHMCIMTGCDYLDGINGIGIKTVHKYFTRYRTADKVIDAMKKDLDPHLIPDNYDEKFVQAELAFLHQYVWDPDIKTILNYSPIDQNYVRELGIDDLTGFLGGDIVEYAKDIASGILNPLTLKPFSLINDDVDVDEKENIPFTPPSSQPLSVLKDEKELLKPELPFKLTIDRVKNNSSHIKNSNVNDEKKIEENFKDIRSIVAKRITFKRPFYNERPLELPGLSTCINFDYKAKGEIKPASTILSKFIKKK